MIELFEEIRIRQFFFFEAKLTRASSCFTIKQFLFSKQNKFTIRANRFQIKIFFLIDSTSNSSNPLFFTNDKRQTFESTNSIHVSTNSVIVSTDPPLQASSDERQAHKLIKFYSKSFVPFYPKRLVLHTNRFVRIRQLSTRYQYMINVSIWLQNDETNPLSISYMKTTQYTRISFSIMKKLVTFVKSRRKEINDLLKKNVFEIIQKSQILEKIKIFDSQFVDEIKNIDTITIFEKFRLVIQSYNDQKKNKDIDSNFYNSTNKSTFDIRISRIIFKM